MRKTCKNFPKSIWISSSWKVIRSAPIKYTPSHEKWLNLEKLSKKILNQSYTFLYKLIPRHNNPTRSDFPFSAAIITPTTLTEPSSPFSYLAFRSYIQVCILHLVVKNGKSIKNLAEEAKYSSNDTQRERPYLLSWKNRSLWWCRNLLIDFKWYEISAACKILILCISWLPFFFSTIDFTCCIVSFWRKNKFSRVFRFFGFDIMMAFQGYTKMVIGL